MDRSFTMSRLPSRFLKEIPSEFTKQLSGYTKPATTLKDEQFRTGDLVIHSTFGKGRVVKISGQGAGLKLQVDFFNFGRKTLMQIYAKVRKIQ